MAAFFPGRAEARKILPLYLIFVVVSLVLFIAASSLVILPEVRKGLLAVQADAEHTALQVELNNLERYIDTHVIALRDLAGQPLLAKAAMLGSSYAADLQDSLSDYRLLGKRVPVYVLDIAGNVIHRTRVLSTPTLAARDMGFRRLLEDQSEVEVRFFVPANRPMFRIAVPVRYGGHAEGVLVAELPLSLAAITGIRSEPAGHALVLRAHDAEASIRSGPIQQPRAIRGRIPEYGIELLRLTDASHFEAFNRALMTKTLASLLLCSILGFVVFAVLGYRYLIAPYRRLSALAAELEQSEQRYRDLYNKTPVMLHSIDQEGRLISVSDYWLDKLGYRRHEVIGSASTDYLTEESRRYAVEQVLPTFQATGFCRDVPYQIVKHNGEVIDVLLSAEAEHDADGQVTRSLAVMVDVTATKRAEEALRQRHAEQRLIFDHVPADIWYLDDRSTILRVNRQAAERMGMTVDQAEGRNVYELFPDLAATYRRCDNEVFESGQPKIGLIEKRDGVDGAGWVRTDKVPYSDAQTGARYLLVVSQDVTDEIEDQRFLQQLHETTSDPNTSGGEKLDRVLDALCGFLGLSCALICRVEHDACEIHRARIEGRRLESGQKFLVDQLTRDVVNSKDVVSFTHGAGSVIAGECYRLLPCESCIGCAIDVDDERFGTLALFGEKPRSVPFRNTDKSYVRLVAQWIGNELARQHHIEDLERSEQQLSQSVEQLSRSNEELERFASVASHDLQEPLRVVLSYNSLLQQRYGAQLDATANEYLGFAQDAAQHMQALIADLLQYARLGEEGENHGLLDARAVFDAACKNLIHAVETSGAEITCGALPTVAGNKVRLTRLMQNLIGNAIKYCAPGVTPRVDVAAEREGNQWHFTIVDNGIGIDQKYLDQIFVPFKRLHSRHEYSGTGIGLAVCKKIVESHGGRIWVTSGPRTGSVFHFTLADADTQTVTSTSELKTVA